MDKYRIGFRRYPRSLIIHVFNILIKEYIKSYVKELSINHRSPLSVENCLGKKRKLIDDNKLVYLFFFLV